MKVLSILIVFSFLTACSAQAVERESRSFERPESNTAIVRKPLLVELFTSEGCSSCPPAEELLSQFEQDQPFEDVELVTLAFHVDYWDGLGWKDKYASPLFTQRQQIYDRKFRTGKIYTPQMVVDGDLEFVGSRENDARKAFQKAVKSNKARLALTVDGKNLEIAVGGLSGNENSTVFLAIAEDNVSSDVSRGENAGKKLTHLSVVRKLIGIGMIPEAVNDYRSNFALVLEDDWKRENLKFVVFVQENSSRNVLAVGQVRFENE